MRDYSKVAPSFWIGKTGKLLRGNAEAQIVAMFLMTAPNAEMTGVFHCPIWQVTGITGLAEEGASKGLQRLMEIGFCTYDDESEFVFVHEMAKYQIAEELKANDNQVKSVRKAFSSMKGAIKQAFFERYKDAFHLTNESPSKAPSKPIAGTEAGTEAKTPHTPQGGQAEKKSNAVALKTYLQTCKTVSCKPIPEDDPVFEYATGTGIPRDFLGLHWLEFKDRYSEPGSKKYKDWPSVFRKSVRGNWFRLWYLNNDGYLLTTTGQQAKKIHEGKA